MERSQRRSAKLMPNKSGLGTPGPKRSKMKDAIGLVTVATATAAATALAPAATVTATTTAAAATGGTIFARTRDIHSQCAAVDRRAVQGVDGFLSLFRAGHGHEGKSARAAAHTIDHQIGFNDRAMRCERVLQIVLCRIERQVPDKQFGTHVMFDCPRLTLLP